MTKDLTSEERRERQISNAAWSSCSINVPDGDNIDLTDLVINSFAKGAQWADENPKSDADKVVSYPCNSFGDKNKVCAVLKRMISEITYVNLQENTTEHYDKTEFIEDFCKVMEEI